MRGWRAVVDAGGKRTRQWGRLARRGKRLHHHHLRRLAVQVSLE